MNKKKTIAVAIVLALVLVIGGLIAYFTDTEETTNVFTIGNVNITLTEPNWDDTDVSGVNGVPDAAEARTPGQVIAKDPTVAVNSGSNDAFVFLKIEVPAITEETAPSSGVYTVTKRLFTYTPNSDWEVVSTTVDATSETVVYAYTGVATASGTTGVLKKVSAGTTLPALFDEVTVNGTITNAEVTANFTGNQNVVVTAYGIQADGLSVSAPAAVFGLF